MEAQSRDEAEGNEPRTPLVDEALLRELEEFERNV